MTFNRRMKRWGLFLRRLQREIGYDDCMGMAAQIAYLGFNMFLDSVHHGARSITPLRTPLAIPQAIWLLGLGFCLLCGALVVVAAVAALVRGDWAAVQTLVGIKSVDEQIHEETDA